MFNDWLLCSLICFVRYGSYLSITQPRQLTLLQNMGDRIVAIATTVIFPTVGAPASERQGEHTPRHTKSPPVRAGRAAAL